MNDDDDLISKKAKVLLNAGLTGEEKLRRVILLLAELARQIEDDDKGKKK